MFFLLVCASSCVRKTCLESSISLHFNSNALYVLYIIIIIIIKTNIYNIKDEIPKISTVVTV